MPTVKELAAKVLLMFEGQQRYFKNRSTENLAASKAAERALKEECERIVSPAAQQQLFEQTKRMRVTSADARLVGVEFEVPAGASEEEIADAAWEAIGERISYGWEEVG